MLPSNREDRIASELYLLAIVIAILLGIQGCHTPAPVPVQLGPSQYEAPVSFNTFDAPTGWDPKDMTIITVPASSPSETPTVIAVRRKPKTVMQKILPSRKEQDFEVVSNNQGVRQAEEASIPWWMYALGAAASLSAITAILSYFRVLSPVIAFIARLFRKG